MTPQPTVDVVVIGAGINGMVAAAELALAGKRVALVERAARIGGFIASAERTVPGYLHDTYSSWHPLFVSGSAYATLGPHLRRLGLEYRNTDGPLTATVGGDGRVVAADRDPETTAAGFAFDQDRAAYLAAIQSIADHGQLISRLMDGELRAPSLARAGWSLARIRGPRDAESWLQDLASSGRAYCRRHYRGDEVDRLWVPWLLHAGLAPDNATGGFMLPLLAASLHGAGLPVVRGGAQQLVTAFEKLFTERGVRVLTNTEALRIEVRDKRARAVATSAGTIWARWAVLASVTPAALYDELLDTPLVAEPVRERARRYRFGRAAAQIHVALSAPPAWQAEVLRRVPLFHVSDGASSTAIACAEAEAGLLPREPTIVVGQQYLLDRERVPSGAAALWLQLQEAPARPRADAAGELDASGGWTPALARGYADRVLARLERHAPGLRDAVVGIDVITPDDLTRHNPNAVHGDPYAGSTELDQNFRWRPMAGLPGHRTPIGGLLHIGAATHPGPGLSGGSGHAAAQHLLRRARLHRGAHRP
jgi:phytoene dehydrogenase-like protein